ncbi:MAG: ribulokinase [Bacteroidales bacterium]|nr:ribulokinase [Bacteroidales bacterium]
MANPLVIGIDYGSDSARASLTDAISGQTLASASEPYPRWAEGRYSDVSEARFRHHPLDYLEVLEKIIREVVSSAPNPADIQAIGIDVTASTPCFVDAQARPLSLRKEFAEDPDAMFILWKDHTAASESEKIESLCKNKSYHYQSGGFYGPENFWSKAAHIVSTNPAVTSAATTAIEACDYLAAELTGVRDVAKVCVGETCARVKGLYDSALPGGYPPQSFFAAIHPDLPRIVEAYPKTVKNAFESVGTLSQEWAEKLSLGTHVKVGAGAVDAYAGAIGGGVGDGKVVLNMGTSACYMAVRKGTSHSPVSGVFGQGANTMLPGYTGYEAGLSAFGDVFAWFQNLLLWGRDKKENLLATLGKEAEKIVPTDKTPIATDYFNGRRTPDPNPNLSACIEGLRLGTSPIEIYYALGESLAFASRRVLEHFTSNGIPVESLIGVGGISQKSPFLMQLMADTIGLPLSVVSANEGCVLGSVIHAAVVAGVYPDIFAAQNALSSPIAKTYCPRAERKAILDLRYARYLELCK